MVKAKVGIVGDRGSHVMILTSFNLFSFKVVTITSSGRENGTERIGTITLNIAQRITGFLRGGLGELSFVCVCEKKGGHVTR